MEKQYKLLHESGQWSRNSQSSAFLVATNSLNAKSFSSINQLQDLVFQQQNQIHSAASLQEGRYYWLGLAKGVTPSFSAAGNTVAINTIPVESAGESGIFGFRANRGHYLLDIVHERIPIRQISIYVEPRRPLVPFEDFERGAVNMAVVVPQTMSWMVGIINSLLMMQNFCLVSSKANYHYIYHRQLTMSWNIAVIAYGDAESFDALANTVRYANDVFLVLEGADLVHVICKIAKITGTKSLEFKNGGPTSFSMGYDSLTNAEKPPANKQVVDQLDEIKSHSEIVISAAKMRQPKDNEEKDIEQMLLEWLVLPSSFKGKEVHLRFAFASNMFITEDMARQYTVEIMPTTCDVHRVTKVSTTSLSLIHVDISCSVYSVWILASTLGDISIQYPSLLSVDEIHLVDPRKNETAAEPLFNEEKMTDINQSNESCKKFHWSKLETSTNPSNTAGSSNDNCSSCSSLNSTSDSLTNSNDNRCSNGHQISKFD